MTVYDEKHPRPSTAVDADQLRKYLAETTAKRLAALMPKDAESLKKYREIFGAALGHMCYTTLPEDACGIGGETIGSLDRVLKTSTVARELTIRKGYFARAGSGEKTPFMLYAPAAIQSAQATILAMPHGKADLVNSDGTYKEPLLSLLEKGQCVIVPDLFGTGENNAAFFGQRAPNAGPDFFAGYNRTILANRVHDLLTLIGYAQASRIGDQRVNLIGLGDQGSACLLAAALSNGAVSRVAVDADNFDFDQVKSYDDPRFLPSAQRFGGIWPFAGLIAPAELFVFNTGKKEVSPWLRAAYKAAGAEAKLKFAETADVKTVLEWVTR